LKEDLIHTREPILVVILAVSQLNPEKSYIVTSYSFREILAYSQ
jgi:hypothetical protein